MASNCLSMNGCRRSQLAGKPVALFLHGIGMHGEPYRGHRRRLHIARHSLLRSRPARAWSLRRHARRTGFAAGARADLGAVIDVIHKRYPDAPIVLLGDSMGGVFAADYAWRGEQRLAGLALLVPAFGLNRAQWEKPRGDLKPTSSPKALSPSARKPRSAQAHGRRGFSGAAVRQAGPPRSQAVLPD